MNQDFHYYGTYYAAICAGIPSKDAEEIAWAAQMVDDFTKTNFGHLFGNNGIYTCEPLMETAIHELHWLSDVNNEYLQLLRRIWVPFHFLPGNMRLELFNKFNMKIDFNSLAHSRDIPDCKCICTPNSELVKQMIERVARGQKASNIRIGITMHVLADTWAHQMFVGSPNANVNDISGLIEVSQPPHGSGAPPVGTQYSVTYLGHGRIGHLPDISTCVFQYTPNWCKDSVKLNVSNISRFYNAFAQMVDAMRHIINGQKTDFTLKDYCSSGINIGTETQNKFVQNHLYNVLKAQGNNGDQSNAWLQEFCSLSQPSPYIYSNYSLDKLQEFNDEALVHLSFVMDAVNRVVFDYFK